MKSPQSALHIHKATLTDYPVIQNAVNTMDWEALEFYKKLGYFVEFQRKGIHKNSIFYFLREDYEKN